MQLAIALFCLTGLLAQLQGQTVICEGDPLVLTLSGYSGTIQWEYSATQGGGYAAVPNVVGDSAVIYPTASGWYRAAVSSGTCNTFYSDSLELIVHPRPVADAGADLSLCEGSTGTLGGSTPGSGGTAPYVYAWTPMIGLSSSTIGNPTVTASVTANYMLVVTDANGCIDMDTVIVNVWGRPTVDAGADDSVACGGTIGLSGSATGVGPIGLQWTPASTLSNPNSLTPTASPAGNTSYILTATDSNGCAASDTVMIAVIGASTGIDSFLFSGTIDTSFVVPPCADTLTIEIWGAEGGYNTSSATQSGLGAYQKGKFVLTAGTRLKILVGEKPSISGNGGGGGTFVTLTNNTPLIIAGGGGGSSGATDSPDKHGQAGQTGGTGASGGGLGGTAGNGGAVGPSGFQSGAGGGLLTNGADGWTPNSGGKAFVNGGAGANVGFGIGGFGGGGNGSGYVVGGGGGGYSGGGGGGNINGGVGGGGGSYNSGISPVSTAGVRTGSGRVIISW